MIDLSASDPMPPWDDEFELDGPVLKRDNDDKLTLEHGKNPLSDVNNTAIGSSIAASVSVRKRKRASPSHTEPYLNFRPRVGKSEAFMLKEEDNDQDTKSSKAPYQPHNRAFEGPSYKLSSADELILKMREEGHTDRQIADKLASDGHAHYDRKSISTRVARIRLSLADHVDSLLEEGYKEWTYQDDKNLIEAYARADKETNEDIERIRSWRFRRVAEQMRHLDKTTPWSAKACEQRYCALIEETAKIPIEMDDDPEARRAEMEQYREQRQRIRELEQTEKDLQIASAQKLKDERKATRAEKAEEVATRRARLAQQKAQRAIERAEKHQHKAELAVQEQQEKKKRSASLKTKRDGEAKATPRKMDDKGNATRNTGDV